MSLSYLEFLLVFVVPAPLAVALGTVRGDRTLDRRVSLGTSLLVVVALGYTIPWDNYLVARGVWEYAPGSVLLFLPHAPIEEYFFVCLQTIGVGVWTGRFDHRVRGVEVTRRDRLAGALAGTLVFGLGVGLLGREEAFYLGAILAWAGPVLALQWGFGWPVLWRARRTVALCVLVPATYFAIVDRIAIELGLWSFSPRFTTGVELLGLPIEEALFFVATTLFVVQGLVLFAWVIDA